jgi:hypothetical protein
VLRRGSHEITAVWLFNLNPPRWRVNERLWFPRILAAAGYRFHSIAEPPAEDSSL